MSNKGIRYSQDKKQEVVDYVLKYNSENNGRGGVANATKKFAITAMTIKAWVDKYGGETTYVKASGKASIYIQLAEIQKQIDIKEAELNKLLAKSKTLKSKVEL